MMIFFSTDLLLSCWNKIPEHRPSASEIAEMFSLSPRLISPYLDVPMASVNLDLEMKKNEAPAPKIASDFLSLKLLIPSEHNKHEEQSYSPMTGISLRLKESGSYSEGRRESKRKESETGCSYVDSGYMEFSSQRSDQKTVRHK